MDKLKFNEAKYLTARRYFERTANIFIALCIVTALLWVGGGIEAAKLPMIAASIVGIYAWFVRPDEWAYYEEKVEEATDDPNPN